MTRLIDADALGMDMWIQMGIVYGEDIGKAFADIVRNAPTIDAEPIVRCKDCDSYVECAYWFDDKDKRYECHICTAHSIEVGTDDYCSFGERREP